MLEQEAELKLDRMHKSFLLELKKKYFIKEDKTNVDQIKVKTPFLKIYYIVQIESRVFKWMIKTKEVRAEAHIIVLINK